MLDEETVKKCIEVVKELQDATPDDSRRAAYEIAIRHLEILIAPKPKIAGARSIGSEN